MFYRNVRYAAELTNTCKSGLLQLYSNPNSYARVGFRQSIHSARRSGRRPTFKNDPLENIQIESGPLHISSLFRPFAFTIGVSVASLTGCVIWEYENLRQHAAKYLRKPGTWLSSQQRKILAQSRSEPGPIRKWWSSLNDNEKVFFPILGANLLVFGAWRIRALQPTMVKYFCSNPSGGSVCLPMILSTFSHYSTLHLAANMYVLHSFMPAALASLGKEQFVAMYVTGGVVSSFTSILYKVATKQPGLSLGASGAIMAVLAYVCMQYPDTRLSIIFLPMYTFAAGTAIKVIMSVDLAGVIMGWKVFDHAAHLGGALFGIAWCLWGNSHIWGNRDKFLQYYHTLRKTDGR
ncbi:presenilins-associated rhomboid-like protein, mitochondrial [Leguminivora glycinivorella]|uniref:presenilins-associated rhomboid-like protein, mitochondrial n=1 Tax=Leguminivora glycinivorella TaxID=1035111 RepID=UPI00200BC25C|nr:presenilins-associated rhomboid-like protein, mitochondrial [Leguminivora glycinivorella]